MENLDLEKVYAYIDRYTKLNFLVRVLTNNSSKSAEEFNTATFDIDFSDLGLSDEAAMVLSANPNVVNLKKFASEIMCLAEQASIGVFGHMVRLSSEEKEAVKEYVDGMVATYLNKVGSCQDAYYAIVVEIEASIREENAQKTRALGKMAKASLNKITEYNTICQNYSNVSSYLRGMISHRGLK